MNSERNDRGALSASVLTWILAAVGLMGVVATLGWVGAFGGDDPATDFRGTVVDSLTGEPLPGVTVAATDTDGAPISGLSATTTVEGKYLIAGLTSDEYGLRVDGSATGHETGYVAIPSGPYGHEVVPTWGAAATYAPGVVGDIALDPLSGPGATTVPTTETTSPSTTSSATSEPTATEPGTPAGAVTTTTAGFLGPTIGTLTATPSLVSPSRVCGTSTTQFTVNVTHPSGLKSVVVQWSYPTAPAGAPAGTASGTATLTQKAGTDTWIGGTSFWQQPSQEQTWITLKVVATANDTYYRSRTFSQTLAIERC